MLTIPRKIDFVLNTLISAGFEAYLVGGCVRDMLMGIIPHDYDITTSATPDEVIKLFKKTVPTGIKHGTVTVIEGEASVEVTTYRTEGKYQDHRKPESVTFVSNLNEDLSRRDFTVNAICYNSTDGIIDCFGGVEDIKNGILRAVGEPKKRFEEDALRILRLFRFSSVLGFEIEENTLNAALETAHLLKDISAERISSEIKKALNGKNIAALKPLTDIGALDFLGLKAKPDYKKIKQFKENDISLFAFLYSADADILNSLNILKCTNKEKELFGKILFLLKFSIPQNKFDIKEMLFKTDTESFKAYILFLNKYFDKDTSETEKLFKEIIALDEPYKISQLDINGNDLKELGINGKKTGQILEELRRLVSLDPTLNEKQLLIKNIKI